MYMYTTCNHPYMYMYTTCKYPYMYMYTTRKIEIQFSLLLRDLSLRKTLLKSYHLFMHNYIGSHILLYMQYNNIMLKDIHFAIASTAYDVTCVSHG